MRQERSSFSFKLDEALFRLASLKSSSINKFCKILKSQGSLSKQQIQQVFKALVEELLNPAHTQTIIRVCRPIVIQLIVILCRDSLNPSVDRQLLTISALSKVLPLYPDVAGVVIEYLQKSASIFDALLSYHPGKPLDQYPEGVVLEFSRTIHRLLRFSSESVNIVSQVQWNWGSFFCLLKFHHPEVRWNVAKSVTLLGMCSNQVGEDLLSTVCSYSDDQQFLKNLMEDESFEQSVLLLDSSSSTQSTPSKCEITIADLHPSLVDVCGVLLFKNSPSDDSNENQTSSKRLALTHTTVQNLRAIALAICQHNPILLEGITGSGKTALIDELAKMCNNTDIIKIHLGDQSDAKVLLGTYICTETPGEFKWQPGALTQAVKQGKWIIIEDIDLASVDVISVILPLLETRKLFIPSRGEEIPAAHGFQIFATETLFGEGFSGSRVRVSGKLLSKFWTKIVVNPLPQDELLSVVQQSFPELAHIADRFVQTFQLLKQNSHQQMFTSGRPVSSRDLFKWCKRVNRVCDGQKVSIQSAQFKELVFCEAYDCFCAMLANPAHRVEMMKHIAPLWNILEDHVEYFFEKYKPSFQSTKTTVSFGRQQLIRSREEEKKKSTFAHTTHALRSLERISVCVKLSEPVLLVGETGTGKTSVVQYLADQIGKKLIVQNLSQQSDSTDLLGGFKPIELRSLCIPLKNEFDQVFPKTFSKKSNKAFLDAINHAYATKNWEKFVQLLHSIVKRVEKLYADRQSEPSAEQQSPKPINPALRARWNVLGGSVKKFIEQRKKLSNNNFAFAFVEGALVNAVRNGDWVLLDEINLATTETLESLSGLLEGGSLYLTERGDISAIQRHPEFRIFACMNPPTDIGKKDLPPGLRNRFTEFFVDELASEADLKTVVLSYLQPLIGKPPIEAVVKFYLAAKQEAKVSLSDGANQKPHYSLRSLCRALQYTCDVVQQFGFYRALYEGICMSFLTQLNRKSYPVMEQLIRKHIVEIIPKQDLKTVPKQPAPNYIKFNQFWIEAGPQPAVTPENYILTKTIKSSLTSLARIVLTRKYPVLLQGPTSSGKTSMVQYLATTTGHRFVRINNHEHTDIQEYLGCYVSDSQGNLVFQEGILVEAVRNGHWVVLDELNLAPSEVLEALNRLLDDNRELFIPETQETIKPHPHFMLFATQNPPGLYGGRKVLSRAFRNRFLELHFDDIPDDELQTILEKRAAIAPSYCKKLVSVMKDLQRQRHGTQVFAGKNSLITLRDLFRWANRQAVGYEALAADGYMLLAERLRNAEEKHFIKEILEKHMNVKLDLEKLYDSQDQTALNLLQSMLKSSPDLLKEFNIIWTPSMKRMFILLSRCLEFQEPVLMVGETGCGKTTVCQLFAILRQQQIQILNCHQHTETADFLGSLRPIRGKDAISESLKSNLIKFLSGHFQETMSDFEPASSLTGLIQQFETFSKLEDHHSEAHSELSKLITAYKALFEWQDGPLVISMKRGDLFLVDEISLAEDSVLERLNSVLEPDRLLVLAEKGGNQVEEIYAVEAFRMLATMNPGGDFGKRELSPALRNRFTEIWVPSITARDELIQIARERLASSLDGFAVLMIDFLEWFKAYQHGKRLISLRDILSWINFMNVILQAHPDLNPFEIYMHGACLVILDGLPVSLGYSERKCKQIREAAFAKLLEQLHANQAVAPKLTGLDFAVEFPHHISHSGHFGIPPFVIPSGPLPSPANLNFSLQAPTTSMNLMRILRAMQIHKPILLEGSPGVGKTSLITALAAAAGYPIVRINLSEQTDMMDLLGSDLPVEGGKPGEFGWSDGVFLRALKQGSWVLLDELNLASQSVLEGLNSCLDHRGTVYIPEVGQEFKCPESFRVFACQNPTQQGGGRKGLPKSFLNRFAQVYVEKFEASDLLFIAGTMFPQLAQGLLEKMISFNSTLYNDSMVHSKFARKGSPWEFNLRDIFRWCELLMRFTPAEILAHGSLPDLVKQAARFVDLIYLQRMRTKQDREYITQVFQSIFQQGLEIHLCPPYSVNSRYVQIGTSNLARERLGIEANAQNPHLVILPSQLNALENIMKCIQMNWMVILLGSTASGKTSLIQLLAQLVGKHLHQFWMNSSVDTTELLGGFEQVDLVRKKKSVFSATETLVRVTTELLILISTNPGVEGDFYLVIHDLHNRWDGLQRKLQGSLGLNSGFDTDEKHFLGDLLSFIKQHASTISPELDPSINLVHSLLQSVEKQLHQLELIQAHSITGCFEWIDGILIQAVEQGDWLLIDNVNFCNPSVLDRLNPLLEPNGSLMVNERGITDGEVKVIRPHPNFRIFLTMDPDNGEISRAMRNRGIEINLLDHVNVSNDLIKLLNLTGIPGIMIPKAMIRFHQKIQTLYRGHETNLNIRDFLRWARLTRACLQRGEEVEVALTDSMKQVYIFNQRNSVHQQHILSHYETLVIESIFTQERELPSGSHLIRHDCSLRGPGLWFAASRFNTIFTNVQGFTNFHLGSMIYYLASEWVSSKFDQHMSRVLEKSSEVSHVRNAFSNSTLHAYHQSTMVNQLHLALVDASQVSLKQFQRFLDGRVANRGSFARILDSNQYPTQVNEAKFYWLFYTTALTALIQAAPRTLLAHASTWLKTFVGPLEEFETGSKLIHYIVSHPLSSTVDALYQKIVANLHKILPENFQFPTDLRSNQVLLRELGWNIQALKNHHELQSDFLHLSNLQPMMDLLFERIIQGIYEESIYTRVDKEGLTIIKQSHALHHHSLRTETVNPLVELSYPLFQKFDSLLDKFFRALTPNSTIQLGRLREVFIYRDALWDCFHQLTLNSERFLGIWSSFKTKWLELEFHQAPESKPLLEHITAIDQCCVQLNLVWSTNGLRQYGVKPFVLKTPAVISLMEQIQAAVYRIEQFVHTLSITEQMELKSSQSFQERSKLILDGLCTIQWLDQHFQEGAQIYESLRSLPDILASDLIAFKQQFLQEAHPMQDDENEEEPVAVDKTKAQLLWLEYSSKSLVPLRDHQSIVQESVRLQELFRILFSDMQHARLETDLSQLIHSQAKETFDKLASFTDYVLKHTSRPPTDAVAYKHLLWSSEANDSGELGQSLTQLPGLWQQMLFQYSSRIWMNSYSSSLALIHASRNHALNLQNSNSFQSILFSLESEGGNYRKHIGSSQLYSSIQSTFGFHLNCSLSTLPLLYRREKHEQLIALNQHYQSLQHFDLRLTEWKFLLHSLGYVLHCQFLFHDLASALDDLQQFWNELEHNLSYPPSGTTYARESELYEFLDQVPGDSTWQELKTTYCKASFKSILDFIYHRGSLSAIDEVRLRSRCWVMTGLLQFALLLPNSNVDPTSKHTTKNQVYLHHLAKVQAQQQARKLVEQLQTASTDNHFISILTEQLNYYQAKTKHLETKITLRPSEPSFASLHDELHRFNNHSFTQAKIEELWEHLAGVQGTDREAIWQDRTNEFIQILSNKYAGYQDVVFPIINAIYQAKHGFRLLSSQIATIPTQFRNSVKQFFSSKEKLEQLIMLLSGIPGKLQAGFSIARIHKLLSEESIGLIDVYVPDKDRNEIYSRFLRAILASIFNLISVKITIDKPVLDVLDRLFTIFTLTWQKIKEEERERKRKLEELYKYKELTHDTGETEEEEDERMMRELFPDYSSQFQDLELDPIAADDAANAKEAQDESSEPGSAEIEFQVRPTLGDRECYFLYEAYLRLFTPEHFSECDNRQELLSREFILAYECASRIYTQFSDKMPGAQIDEHCTNAHLVASHIMSNRLIATPNHQMDQPESYEDFFPNSHLYNIHTDPNVPEAQLLLTPLNSFKQAVFTVLAQFPEHPVLQQLLKIIDRLLQFPVHSPLMQFITGLELLLRQAHEWEEFAHSKISLQENMKEIGALIARWRKIELRSWPNILSTCLRKYELRALKWWFDLYQNCILALDSCAKNSAEEQEKFLQNLVQVLTDFAQASNVGEFPTRMKLLDSFATQLKLKLKLENSNNLFLARVRNLLKNLHSYYMQYWNQYTDWVDAQKKPIQKELLDYIKLAKWEKLEYYVLKSVAERSHRKLSRFSRNYEKILSAPVANLWKNPEESLTPPSLKTLIPKQYSLLTAFIPPKPKTKRVRRRRTRKSKGPEKSAPVVISTEDIPRVTGCIPKCVSKLFDLTKDKEDKFHYREIPKYIGRVKKFFETKLFYGETEEYRYDLISSLEILSTDILERTEELRDQKKPLNEKQLALTSFIRTLREMGVSHHKDVMQDQQLHMAYFLQLPALETSIFDFEFKFSDSLSFTKEQMRNQWLKASNYYYRNLTRIQKVRELAVNPPNRDLTRNQVIITTGYLEHFLSIGLTQRNAIHAISEPVAQFRKHLLSFQAINNPWTDESTQKHKPSCSFQTQPLPIQTPIKQFLEQQSSLSDELFMFLSQVRMVLESTQQARFAQEVSGYQTSLLAIKTQFTTVQHTQLITPQNFSSLHTNVSQLDQILSDLQRFSSESTYQQQLQTLLHSCQTHLQGQFEKIVQAHPESPKLNDSNSTCHLSEPSQKLVENFLVSLEQSTSHILIVVQRLLKSLPQLTEDPSRNQTQTSSEDNDEDEELMLNIPHVQQKLLACIKEFQLPELNEKLETLIQTTAALCDHSDRTQVADLLVIYSVQGFLHEFTRLMQEYQAMLDRVVYHFLEWHKSTMKLTYILSGLLSTLLQQGFCRAPDEQLPESDTVEESSGTGLGSGEGKDDISKDIEDEEQLQKPENDPEQSNPAPEEQDNAMEASQDFQSEMFDVKPNETQDDDQSESEDEESEHHDTAMGDLDQEQQETVDEKLWDEEDDQEQDPNQKQQEGDPLDSNQLDKDELMANENENRQPGSDDERSDEEANPEPQDASDGDDQDDGSGSQEEDDEDHMDGEMVDVQDESSKLNDLPPEEEFELPDEMNLDSDNDQDDSPEEADAPDDANGSDQEMSDPDADPDPADADDKPEEDPEADADQDPPPDAEQKPDDPTEAQDDQNDEDEDVLTKNSAAPQEQPQDDTFGARDDEGQNSMRTDINDDLSAPEKPQTDENRSELQENSLVQSNAQDSYTQNQSQADDQEQPSQSNPSFDPNPYRSLGDASKQWQQQVKLIREQTLEQSKNTPKNDSQPDMDKQEFQFQHKDDQPDENDLQALAPATEEQAKDPVKPTEETILDPSDDPDSASVPDQEQSQVDSTQQEQLPAATQEEDHSSLFPPEEPDEEPDSSEAAPDSAEATEPGDQPMENLPGQMSKFDPSLALAEQSNQNLDPARAERLTPEQIQEMREELELLLAEWRENHEQMETAQKLWNHYEELTQVQAQELCEQLRLILEPTLATKLRGDFRSGKRINMKKVIPYIASQFRKDKIWLRRTKPNKRHYQVLVAIDDSQSMSTNKAGPLACEALTMIAKSLNQLEVGQLAIMKFGETVQLVHPFDQPFTDSIGPQVISQFTFEQKGTNVLQLLNTTVNLLDQARLQSHSQTEHVQLVFVISDGRLNNHAGLGQWIREAEKKRMLIVFIVIDSPDSKDSILELKTVSFVKAKDISKSVVQSLYIDDFPFPYYVILKDLSTLPDVLADTLRQWFELLQNT